MESGSVGIWKKDPIQECDNQLRSIRQEKLELLKRIDELSDQENNTLNARRDAGIRKYIKHQDRERILSAAEKLGYSHDVISSLRDKSHDWNQDTVTNETIDKFVQLEQFIRSQAAYKSNIFYRIGSWFPDDGGNDNDN